MVRIKVEDVIELQRKIELINSLDISDIIFTENNEELNIPDKVKEAWSFIGMNNITFITSGFYKDALTEEESIYL